MGTSGKSYVVEFTQSGIVLNEASLLRYKIKKLHLNLLVDTFSIYSSIVEDALYNSKFLG
jgi:hypothetical protein